MTTISVSSGNKYFTSEDGLLYDISKKRLLKVPGKKAGSIVIPKGVIEIDKDAFIDCSELTKISIPESVTTVCSNAFDECSALLENTMNGYNSEFELSLWYRITTKQFELSIANYSNKKADTVIEVPDSIAGIPVSRIGYKAFRKCINVAEIVLPESIEIIEDDAFKGCAKLTRINLPKGLKHIRADAFKGCTSLKTIVIPAGIEFTNEDYEAYDSDFKNFYENPLPDFGGLVLYVSPCTPAYLFAKKLKSGTFKHYADPDFDYTGMVDIKSLKMLVAENDVATFKILLPFYKQMYKQIDNLIDASIERKNAEMTAFLLDWKYRNIDIEAQQRRLERKAMRELVKEKDPSAPKTAIELRKLWVVRKDLDKTLTICGYKGNEAIVEIPEKIGTKTVVAISGTKIWKDYHGVYHHTGEYEPFGRSSVITHITIPASVTTFEDGSFFGCPNLTIHAPADSAAEKYANDNGIAFLVTENIH